MTTVARPTGLSDGVAAPNSADDPLWYKDAIIYELRTRSFFDSNGDGIGDLAGLAAKLDYVEDLGVTAIWLLPLCPSPGKDDGYDIADYMDVQSDLGTLDDLKTVIAEAKRRHIRIITELVLNHTSDQHPWFQRARRAPVGSVERNFYVWSETPDRYRDARIIFKDFEPSNWTWDRTANAYFWHRFFSHQPDLNFENPAVHDALFEVVDFWFGLGIDGLRLDAVPYLYEEEGTNCENLPATHAFLKKLRAHIDGKWTGKMLLAEANQWPEDAAAYFGQGDECHMNFHFPIMPRLFMSIQMEDRFPIIDILAQTPQLPPTCQWAMFLRNHDELTLEMVTDEERDYMYRAYALEPAMRLNLGIRRRLAPLLGNDRRRMELLNGLLFSLPGTPVLYYGDEIGMGDNIYLGDRNGVRTPMQWDSDRNAGFSRVNPQKLILPVIIDPEYHFEAVNVEAQQNNTHSFLWWTKRLIALRKRHRAFGRGTIEFLHPDNAPVLAFVRRFEDETILIVANLSRSIQYVELDLKSHAGRVPRELFGGARLPAIGDKPYVLTLGSFAFYWLSLDVPVKSEARRRLDAYAPPSIEASSLQRLTAGDERDALRTLLPAFLASRPWFRARHRDLVSARVDDAVSLGRGDEAFVIAFVRVELPSGDVETYALPLAFVPRSDPREVADDAVVASARIHGVEGWLVDALADAASARPLLDVVLGGVRAAGGAGELVGRRLDEGPNEDVGAAKALSAHHANATIQYGDRLLLKVYRRLDDGPNPELDATLQIAKRAPGLVPRFLGAAEYRYGRGQRRTVAVLQQFVHNEGTGWEHTCAELGRFYERILTSDVARAAPPLPQGSITSLVTQEPPASLAAAMGGQLTYAELLGTRTADMHLALAASDDPALAPEPFSSFDRRSTYQSFRNLIGRVIRELRARQRDLPEHTVALAAHVVQRENAILDRVAPLLHAASEGMRMRIHGDYHLGQVLYTGKDFVLIDFDGDASLSTQERRRKRPALRDIARMMRSFRYAASSARLHSVVRHEDQERLLPWEDLWSLWSTAAFLRGYLAKAGGASFLPANEAGLTMWLDRTLFARMLHELEEAVVDGSAPIDVPLADIARTVDG
ncbi:MAG TPA: maltose alpha-D-glucosyltransferase [Polyangiaceae bacterium]|jgi:maltose alpha-D-glucosyltransferase/alpha-amylase